MDFIGKICPYCQTPFVEEDDVVVCSICEMPHHKECWVENRACTTFGCTGTISGAEQGGEAVQTFCSKCGNPIKVGQKFCPSCGTSSEGSNGPHYQVAGVATKTSYQAPQAAAQPAAQPFAQPIYTPQPQHNQQQQYGQQPLYTPQSQQYTHQVPNYNPQSQYAQQTPYIQQPQYNPSGFGGFNNYAPDDVDLATFIQTNQHQYIQKFMKMNTTNTKTSWNWCSFLFGTFWMAYRKMYVYAAAYYGIAFVAGLIPGLGPVLTLAIWALGGVFGDYLYKQYVETELRAANAMPDFSKAAHIAKKGGTSIGAVFAAFGIAVVISLITTGVFV